MNSRAGNPTYTLSRGAPSANLGTSPNKKTNIMAEREGFEPPVPFGITGFQDQLHKPLGHLSVSLTRIALCGFSSIGFLPDAMLIITNAGMVVNHY